MNEPHRLCSISKIYSVSSMRIYRNSNIFFKKQNIYLKYICFKTYILSINKEVIHVI